MDLNIYFYVFDVTLCNLELVIKHLLFCYNIEIDMLVQNTVREQAHLMLSNFQIVFKKQNILKHFVPT